MRFRRSNRRSPMRFARRSRGADLLPLNLCRSPFVLGPSSCAAPVIQATLLLSGQTAGPAVAGLSGEALAKGIRWRGAKFDYKIGSTGNTLGSGTNVVAEIRQMIVVMQIVPATGAPAFLPDPFSIDEQLLGERVLWRALDYSPIAGADPSPFTTEIFNPSRIQPIEIRSRVNLREDQAIFHVIAGVNPALSGNITYGYSLFGFHAVKAWL